MNRTREILDSRAPLMEGLPEQSPKQALEGGCGVVGVIASEPIAGRSIIRPCHQMRNRGNGKGGGIAALGVFPDYPDHYAIQLAYIDESVRSGLEKEWIFSNFTVDQIVEQPTIDDHRDAGLEIRPPAVVRYFARVREEILDPFMNESGINERDVAEDEFVFQNSFRINRAFYADAEKVQAFILSHGKNLMVLKGVGYAEEICVYYRLEETKAHGWIGHQRYPTRGRVWHPGGAHPFVGLHEALVHNGDFANYYAVTEYLRQRNIYPLFITDTEVSVLLFDLYSRVYGYPLEFVIEALAPTTERDFDMLDKKKQRIYRAIKNSHMHGSPDGPWFFIITRNDPRGRGMELIGITDTSMLRPQVFAFQQGDIDIGVIASEKQAIDALLEEVAKDHPTVSPVADRYWNARGGSHSDGGTFIYRLVERGDRKRIEVTDKFGKRTMASDERPGCDISRLAGKKKTKKQAATITKKLDEFFAGGRLSALVDAVAAFSYEELAELLQDIIQRTTKGGDLVREHALTCLTALRDRRYDTGRKKRNVCLSLIDLAIDELLLSFPAIESRSDSRFSLIDFQRRHVLKPPQKFEATLLIDARDFAVEGEECAARLMVTAYRLGWKRFIVFRCTGDRFLGCGLGAHSEGVVIHVYGSNGDYLGSGLDGAEIIVHNNAQDQVGQILKSGKIIIYGDVGQTFLYGAKGGQAYVMGNAAGRPLINAVGYIRAIINGTCLDYCAESFMAGQELGGGFVIINGIYFTETGQVMGLSTKYPGSNFFSLASGGAGYVNDPYYTVSEMQLNSARFVPFTQEDWNVILPFLRENETLFGISIRRDLLTVDGVIKWPKEVFRKVVACQETHTYDWSLLPW